MSLIDDINNNTPPVKAITEKESSQTPKLKDDQIESISRVVKSAFGLDNDLEGFDIICISMQKGGVNTKQGGGKSNRNKVSIPFNYGEKNITTSQVNKYILSALPNLKIRQVARSLATRIKLRSVLYKQEGFLVKQLLELYPKQWEAITDPEKRYWAADFQHDNEDCPEEIRNLLKLRYQDRYKPTNQRSYNKDNVGVDNIQPSTLPFSEE